MNYIRARTLCSVWLCSVWAGLCVALLAACGGGGGGESAPLPEIDLGLRSATVPTRVSRSFLNPLPGAATVTVVPTEGAIAFDPDDFPAEVPGGFALNLGLLFTPAGPGAVENVVTLRFTSGGAATNVSFLAKAQGEEISWTITPDPPDFGDVLPGEEEEVEILLQNDSQISPVTFSGATPPSIAFTILDDPFPMTIDPGNTGLLRVRFAPTAIAPQGGILRLGDGDPGGPLDVTLWANSSGSGEKIIDLGTQTLFNGETNELTVDVPADAVSVTFEGTMTSSAFVGLRMLEGPGGKVYENVSQTGAVLWIEEREVFSIHLPSSDAPGTQLVPGGGTYRFKLYRFSGTGTSMDVRVIIERRASGTNPNAVLPLNIYFAQGITPTAATADSNAHWQAVLSNIKTILSAQGISIGDIDYYDILDTAFNSISQGEEDQLFRTSSTAEKVRLNLFLVQSVWSGQLLGLSGAIDGPKKNGSSESGVVSLYFDAQAQGLAAIIAHEICHYLGLWHTVEVNGTQDPINDTPFCPAQGGGASCTNMLMYWEGLGGTNMTNGQGTVVRAHPCLHPPGVGQNAKPTPRRRWEPTEATRKWLQSLPPGWCGSATSPR